MSTLVLGDYSEYETHPMNRLYESKGNAPAASAGIDGVITTQSRQIEDQLNKTPVFEFFEEVTRAKLGGDEKKVAKTMKKEMKRVPRSLISTLNRLIQERPDLVEKLKRSIMQRKICVFDCEPFVWKFWRMNS